MKRFLVLGGYGNTGIVISRLLMQHTNSEVVIAGRSRVKANDAAMRLNQRYSTLRADFVVCDASDRSSLLAAFKDVDFVVAASGTSQYVNIVAEAALEAGIDYLDVQVSTPKIQYLKSIQHRILDAGRTFITDAGFHPGLPAAMVRYAAPGFDEIKKANVGGLLFLNWSKYNFSDSTSAEFVEEIKNYSTTVYKNKKWQKVKMSDKAMMKEFEYPAPFGKVTAYSMFLEEMPLLTELYPSLDETGFYVYGFDKFTNYVVFPLLSAGLKIFPGAGKMGGKLFSWSVRKFSRPPYLCQLKLIAEGIKDGRPQKIEINISHEDGYFLTAVPIAATLMQYVEGLVKPGLHFMAHYPEPLKLMADMKFMGVNVDIKE